MPGFIGVPELILLGLLALILFGPKRLPEMGRGLGKGMREFKDSISGEHGDSESLHGDPLTTPHAAHQSLPTGTTTVGAVPQELVPAEPAVSQETMLPQETVPVER